MDYTKLSLRELAYTYADANNARDETEGDPYKAAVALEVYRRVKEFLDRLEITYTMDDADGECDLLIDGEQDEDEDVKEAGA